MCLMTLLSTITYNVDRMDVEGLEVFRISGDKGDITPLVWDAIEHPGKIAYLDKKRFDKLGGRVTGLKREALVKMGYCTRPGRFIRKLSPYISDDRVSKLAEEYGASFLYTPEVWEYASEVYESEHYYDCCDDLGSCMTDESYVSFYDHNGVEAVAVSVDDDDGEGIVARALLWHNVENMTQGGKITVVDRVYGSPQGEVAIQRWAKENGYHVRYSHGSYFTPSGGVVELKLRYKLPQPICDEYPYFDTFAYLDIPGGYAYTYREDNTVIARNQDGSLEGMFCARCNEFQLELNSTPDGYFCDECTHESFCRINGEWVEWENTFCCDDCRENCHIDDYHGTDNGGVCDNCVDDYCYDEDEGYYVPHDYCTYCDCCGEYFPPSSDMGFNKDARGWIICEGCIESKGYILWEGVIYKDKECLYCDDCKESHPYDVTTHKEGKQLCPTCLGGTKGNNLLLWHKRKYKTLPPARRVRYAPYGQHISKRFHKTLGHKKGGYAQYKLNPVG